MNPEMLNPDERVVFSILKLSRAMRRCPPPRGELPFPPAVGRLLECVAAAPGVSSRELCEALDLRPSSLSEILARAEGEGLLTRAVDEEDRRVLSRDREGVRRALHPPADIRPYEGTGRLHGRRDHRVRRGDEVRP